MPQSEPYEPPAIDELDTMSGPVESAAITTITSGGT